MQTATLLLEDGTQWPGASFGSEEAALGEVVFSTAMTGYQELLTDPSYCGQILVSTLAHVGNVGINSEDYESERIWAAGYVVADLARRHSNWRATGDLSSWLSEHGVPGLAGVDTRALVRHLRSAGVMRGMIHPGLDSRSWLPRLLESPGMQGRDLVRVVSPGKVTHHGSIGPKVVAMDFGMKQMMVDLLVSHGLQVVRVPSHTSAAEVMALQPEGVFLSNGPGDPAALPGIVSQVKELLGKVPIFGICLGHQLLARAVGAETFKLKFGHRGGNQPVLDLTTGRVEITAQNHGFAVGDLPPAARLTHRNLNDNTCEGLELPGLQAFSVQYHPESSPGPHDSRYLFGRFMAMMKSEVGA